MQNVSIFISATTLTAMAIERSVQKFDPLRTYLDMIFSLFRYLVLVHPMKAMTVWTKKTAVQCSLGILIYSFLSALPISILPSMSPAWPSNNSYHCNPAEPQNFVAAFQVTRITLTYFLPLAIMAVLYALIIRKLLHNSNLFSPSQKALEDRQRVVYMLIAMVIIFAACWLPSTLVILLSTFDEKFYENNKSSLTTYVPVTTFLVYFNCIMNPFLYSLMSSQYRRGFISLFKRLGCCCGLSKVKGQDVPSVASVSDVTGKVSLNSSQCSY